MEALAVGDRVESVDSARGWLRYIGTVEGKGETVWYGVEWDQEARGKHDGSYNGRRYFVCEESGHRGSLVQKKVLTERISLSTALQRRYSDNGDLSELSVCSVSGMCVCCATESMEGLVPELKDLNLSNNLIGSWREASRVVGFCPHLDTLNLSGNRIRVEHQSHLASLRQLVLCSMNLHTDDLKCIVMSCPELEELVVHDNAVDTLRSLADFLPKSMKRLDVSRNQIRSWSEVMSLAVLPHLDRLVLSENKIEAITSPLTSDTTWHMLSDLSVNLNPLSQWSSITALNQLPKLVKLRINDTKLADLYGRETVREGVIARLRCLEILNGGEISSDERMDAEKRYLQQQLTLREQDEPIESEERLRELEVKYSMFKVEDLPSSLPPTLRSIGENLIGVNLRLEVSKKLPPTMQVRKLKLMCQKLFKLPATTGINLEYIPPEATHEGGDDDRVNLDKDTMTLQSAKVENHGVILVKLDV